VIRENARIAIMESMVTLSVFKTAQQDFTEKMEAKKFQDLGNENFMLAVLAS